MTDRAPRWAARWARLVAIVALVGALAGCGGHEYSGYSRTPPPDVAGIELPNLSDGGEPFAMVAPPGGLLLVFFGYTNCPDYCPETLASLAIVKSRLGDQADRATVVMVSVDPGRDLESLGEYVQAFVPGSVGLGTDDPQALADAAAPFGVSYSVTPAVDSDTPDEVDVAHTSALFAVNDRGQLVMTWTYGTTNDQLESDVKALLKSDGHLDGDAPSPGTSSP